MQITVLHDALAVLNFSKWTRTRASKNGQMRIDEWVHGTNLLHDALAQLQATDLRSQMQGSPTMPPHSSLLGDLPHVCPLLAKLLNNVLAPLLERDLHVCVHVITKCA